MFMKKYLPKVYNYMAFENRRPSTDLITDNDNMKCQSNDILYLYKGKNIDGLCKCSIDSKIDNHGNTIIHLMASALDNDMLKSIFEKVPTKLKAIVNMPNNDREYPIHIAMDVIENRTDKNFSFIDTIIKIGADMNKTDRLGRIVIPNVMNANSKYARDTSLFKYILKKNDINLDILNKNINDNVSKILKIDNIIYDNNLKINKKSELSTDMSIGNRESNINFIREIVQKYKQYDTRDMTGGYYGKRRIQSYDLQSSELTESDQDNAFVSKKKTNLVNKYATSFARSAPFDKAVVEEHNRIIEKIMTLLQVDKDTARAYSSALKVILCEKYPHLKERKNDAEKIKELAKFVVDEKTLRKAVKDIKIDQIKKQMEENKQRAIERSKSKNSDSKESSEKKTEYSSTSSEQSSPASPKKQKRVNRSSKKPSKDGYLVSDGPELRFTPEF